MASQYYGDGSKYTVIYEANSSTVANANSIYPGQVLTIPTL
ncbi:MAG: LysM peptidoglycan-binding domain-containing protein [Bacillota bacterium]